MDMTHVHLLLNHVPTIGFGIALAMFVIALLMKSAELKRAALVLFVGVGMLTIPTYVSGNSASEVICEGGTRAPTCTDTLVSKTLIQTHEGAALLAFTAILLTAAFAWLGLWQLRRTSNVEGWTTGLVLIMSLVAFGLVARAANIGGEIRHSEIRALQEQLMPDGKKMQVPMETTTPEGHFARKVGAFVLSLPYGWPSLETLHFIGLSLLIGVVLLIDLRMLGVMKNVAFPPLHRLLPWAILGFGINLVSGMLFFVASPEQYAHNIAFIWKLILMMLAGLNAFYFTLFDEAWVLKAGEEAPFAAKAMAVSAIVLWVGVLYFGSMLPFIGGAF
jgi:hypothetical protein